MRKLLILATALVTSGELQAQPSELGFSPADLSAGPFEFETAEQ